MTRIRLACRPTAALAATLALAACATEQDAAREAAYQQCLEDNMAVAMAWEAIEEMCRKRTSGKDHPLDYYPPQED